MAYILVVDDDIELATATSIALEAAGHEVSYELEIEKAEKSMHARKPDLIVLDVMFPESDTAGFELAQKIRHYDDELKDVPILMMTGLNQELSRQFSSGDIDQYWLPVNNFLEKPVDLEVLCDKVSEMLS
ncbi:MAG: response regulator [Candidatus Latescibacteria bacterium]|nr:response regulator [Candidatus Latescibacterota bacterium]